MRPYVYVTRDYGQTWTSIASNLPEYGNVNTIRQDPNNPDLLYVGTEFGFFISLDEGGTWHRFMPNLPVVRIDDVVVHPRENDLVLATHGRSIWILDDITGLQGLTDEVRARPVHLFEPREAVLWKEDIRLDRETAGDQVWEGEPAPDGTAIHYYLRDAVPSAELRIEDPITNEVLRIFEAPVEAGIHRIRWNLEANPEDPEDDDGYTVDTGRYRVVLEVAGVEHTAVARVVEDIWMIF